jgi:hypothetical protein
MRSEGTPKRRMWPLSAAVMRQAMGGFGTWASAWLAPTSGNLADLFGAVNLAAEVTPTYGNRGPTPGTAAVGFDSGGTDAFAATVAGSFNLDAVTSLAGLLVLRAPSPGALQGIGGKLAAGQPYWQWQCANVSGHLRLVLSDGVDTAAPTVAANHCDGKWHVFLPIIDRTANVAQAFSDLGASSTASLSLVGSLSNTDVFRLGGHPLDASLGHQLGFAAIATGDIVNLRANAAAAIASFQRFMRLA